MQSNKKILISGDVYLDNLIHSESFGKLTFASNTLLYGGAFIVSDILKSIYGEKQIIDINIDLESFKNYKCEKKYNFKLN